MKLIKEMSPPCKKESVTEETVADGTQALTSLFCSFPICEINIYLLKAFLRSENQDALSLDLLWLAPSIRDRFKVTEEAMIHIMTEGVLVCKGIVENHSKSLQMQLHGLY